MNVSYKWARLNAWNAWCCTVLLFTGTKWLEIHHFFFTESLPCTLKCYATFRPTFKFSELHWISFAFHFHKQDFLSHNKVKTQANFEFFDQIGRILTMIFPKLSATEVGHLQCVTCIDKCFNKHMRVSTYGHDIALQMNKYLAVYLDQLFPHEIITQDLFDGVCKKTVLKQRKKSTKFSWVASQKFDLVLGLVNWPSQICPNYIYIYIFQCQLSLNYCTGTK